MALQASIDTNFGIPATYWIIGQINIDNKRNLIIANLFGYISAAAATAGNNYIGQRTFSISMFLPPVGDADATINPVYNDILAGDPDVLIQIQNAIIANGGEFLGSSIVADPIVTVPKNIG